MITDIYMLDKGGLETVPEARRLRVELPIIAASGATGVKDMLNVATRLGASHSLI